MDSSAYFERLLRYYEGSFDIARPALLGGSEFSALASFHIRQEKYVLVKKATLWGVDSHEHVLMQQYRTAPGPEEVARGWASASTASWRTRRWPAAARPTCRKTICTPT